MDYISQREKLFENLFSRGYVKTDAVLTALKKTPREEFIPLDIREKAYVDSPLPIGHNQTISAPHMVAIMTEELKVEPENKILEVGCGSGYQAAVLAEITGKGFIYTIERVKPLVELASARLKSLGYENIRVFEGDGTLGLPEHAPFDRIIVTAAAPKMPDSLTEQLAEDGLLLAPVGGKGYQELVRVMKKDGELSTENLGGCVFVPLIGEDGW